MRNIKLIIEYDGTNYAGWQTQLVNSKSKFTNPENNTIQRTIEKTLNKILQEEISIIGSGRTDAGVHALEQVANFKSENSLPINSLARGLNALLPDDIAIKKIEEMREDFHSRYSAKSKIYRYTILNTSFPSPILKRYSYFYPYSLNLPLIKREIKHLLGKHNFKSFCASGSGAKDAVRTIKKISVKRNTFSDWKLIGITIEADGFLYKMVRNIVGTLIDINRKKLKGIKEVLKAGDRRKAGMTAPPEGLCLIKIRY